MTYNRILLLGPYFGSGKEEVMTFRPFVRYVCETVSHDKAIVSSHYNRSFLYDGADDFIPIERQYSEEEHKQKGFIHKEMEQREYFKKSRQIKDKICEKYGCSKKEIVHYNVPYVKNQVAFSIYQKSFTPIRTETKREPLFLFIPSSVENKDKVEDLYRRLSKELDIRVVGDKKCYLQDKNILNIVEYTENGYKYLMEHINSAKMIITPCSHGTFLGNLQQVPTFSGGRFVSPYKRKGLYSFNNNNMVVPSMENTKLVRQILHFQESLNYE